MKIMQTFYSDAFFKRSRWRGGNDKKKILEMFSRIRLQWRKRQNLTKDSLHSCFACWNFGLISRWLLPHSPDPLLVYTWAFRTAKLTPATLEEWPFLYVNCTLLAMPHPFPTFLPIARVNSFRLPLFSPFRPSPG